MATKKVKKTKSSVVKKKPELLEEPTKAKRKSTKTTDKVTKAKTSAKAKAPAKGKDTKVKAVKASVKTKKAEVTYEESSKENSICLVKNPDKWEPVKGEWAVPDDFKPFHLLVEFTTDMDGMLARGLKAVRYVGQIEEDKDPRKMYNLADYDPETLTALAARLGMVTFHSTGRPSKATGISPRLPANTTIRMHLRVSKVKGDLLKATINKVFVVKTRKGKEQILQVGKTDPAFRKLRGINRHLAAAFVNVMAPPARTRQSRRKEADDE